MHSKKWASLAVITSLLVSCLISPNQTVQASDMDDIVDSLTEIYENLNGYERSELTKANHRVQDLDEDAWEEILGEDVVQAIEEKTSKGKAADIMESLAGIIYANPNTDFAEALNFFREDYGGDFEDIFGSSDTLEELMSFFDSFKTDLEAELISTVLLHTHADFDEVVKEALDSTLADQEYKDLDETLEEHIGVGLEDLFDIKDRLNEQVDPDMTARTALISGAARTKGAEIDGPDKLKAGETGEYTFEVTFKGMHVDLSDKVVWNTVQSNLAYFKGNELHAIAGGKVIVTAEALGVTIMTKEVVIDGPPPKTSVFTSRDDYDALVKGGTLQLDDVADVKVSQDKTGKVTADVKLDASRFEYVLEQIDKDIKQVMLTESNEVDQVVVHMPAEFYTALQENGNLPFTVLTPLASYTLPAQAIDGKKEAEALGVDWKDVMIRLIIQKAPKEEQAAFVSKAQDSGAVVLHDLVAFSIELEAGKQTKKLESFGEVTPRHALRYQSETPANRAIGVVYSVEAKDFFPVPTLFESTEKGPLAHPKSYPGAYYGIISSPKAYSDTAKHWAKDHIETLVAKTIASGIDADRFAPDEKITRIQLATMIARAIGLKPQAAEATFKDLTGKAAAEIGYVNAAAEAGIITGYPDKTFQPDKPLTREEVAAILIRAMKTAGVLPSSTQAEEASVLAGFKDQNKVQAWARASVAQAVKTGIMSGYKDKSVQPQRHTTRAEAATMIVKMLISGKLMNN